MLIVIGFLIMAAGGGIVGYGWMMRTSAPFSADYVNLGLIAGRDLVVQCGLTALIVGAVFFAAGVIIHTIDPYGVGVRRPPENDEGDTRPS